MADAFSQIKRKAEDAIGGMIEKRRGIHLEDDTVFKGLNQEELTVPRIEVLATLATAEIIGDTKTGNWFVDMQINRVTNYKDIARDERAAGDSELFDLIMCDELVDFLNQETSVSDFAVFGGGPGEGEAVENITVETVINEHEVMERMALRLYCRPTTADG